MVKNMAQNSQENKHEILLYKLPKQVATVLLEDADPDAFGRLINFLYTGAYVGPDPAFCWILFLCTKTKPTLPLLYGPS
jgi:hypothetical protein